MQAVKDTVMGTPPTAGQKASEAAQKARETGGKAGETGQKVGETLSAALKGGKATAQEKADGIAAEADKAWKAQQGDSAWQKVGSGCCYSSSSMSRCAPSLHR
jgi:hypothetical protein